MEDFDGVFFNIFDFWEALIVVKVDKICGPIVLASLSVFRAVSGEVSYFSALETGVRLVSRGGRVALEVSLRAASLIAVGILPSAEVVASVVSSIVSSRWCPVPVYVHGNWGVVHPSGCIR